MAHRIEVATKDTAQAHELEKIITRLGFSASVSRTSQVYTLDTALSANHLALISQQLTNPVIEEVAVDTPIDVRDFDVAVEIGFKPGVRDTVGETVRGMTEDALRTKLPEGNDVYTSNMIYLKGATVEQAKLFASEIANPLIQRVHTYEYAQDVPTLVPRVQLATTPRTATVELTVPDEELVQIGKAGIKDPWNGERRGPLALDLDSMKAIQAYFTKLGRNPTDIEVESIAQTWSEHCKHTIFANPIRYNGELIAEGIFKRYIRGATEEIGRKLGDKKFWGSVFTDNAGALIFDDKHYVTLKVETHNSPSALDPFGGSITGIVGVNRDAIGFGLGAKPFLNSYFFCVADPEDTEPLFRGANRTQPLLSPRRILEGIIAGVNAGGNQSGIPTPLGGLYIESRFKGKPLVFVGTSGVIPREVAGKPSDEKQAQAGDYIVVIGGRVGMDGIHGATFSSEGLDASSPATAVQIGAPITQKRLSDAVVKEARDRGLYNSMTDNGAGGLSCSVAEMAKECGGFRVDLEKVPLKYQGLMPWQIWISEAQERMTLSVPKENWEEFSALMRRRGVEATVIGEFTDSGKCIVDYNKERIMDMDMDFLHEGWVRKEQAATYTKPIHKEPARGNVDSLTQAFHSMLSRKNIASTAWIAEQYDHEVQAGSVLKPLQGDGRVNADVIAQKPVLGSPKAVVQAHALNPSYSDIDTYHMAAAAIDTAVRRVVSAGGSPDRVALLDNFCWCSSTEPERLGQLVEAAKACYDVSVAYGAPFVSGKDSMFNDFKGYDKDGNQVKVSVPPTLLVTAASVADDATKLVSLDAKMPGDLVYVLGSTHEELGGSEYYALRGEREQGVPYIGSSVPVVDTAQNVQTYRALHQAIEKNLVASAQSVDRGGLAVALAKTAMGGALGMEITLDDLHGTWQRPEAALFSESQGRIVVTVAPEHKNEFEATMGSVKYSHIGEVTQSEAFNIRYAKTRYVSALVESMESAYTAPFGEY